MEFEDFAESAGPNLRAALVAAYGESAGLDAAADAMAYGWEHWERLREMHNPAGYLYRVGQTEARRSSKRTGLLPMPERRELPEFEPALLPALDRLSESQRASVVLVHGFGWKQVEVADMLGVDPATVRKHLSRGLRKLHDTLSGGGQ